MAIYTWRNVSGGAGGAFDDASNWSNASEAVSTSIPVAGDTARLTYGSGAISGTGSVDTLAFAAASWSIIGQLTATTATVNSATLTVGTNGAQLVVNGALLVGQNGASALAVNNGGTVAVTASPSGPVSQFGTGSLTVSARGTASFGGGLSLGVNGATSAAVTGAVLAVGGVFQLGSGSSPGGSGTLGINGGGQVVLSGATDTSTPYLKIGAVDGAYGRITIDGANSLLLLANNSGAVGYRGTGEVTVTGGGSARFNASADASNNALNPALTIGRFGAGSVTVADSGSLVAAGGSIIVGGSGQGTLRIQNGATATSTALVAAQAALAVSSSGGSGAVVIDGSGSTLVASGAAVIGGDNRGSGLIYGGSGSVIATNGGQLQTGDMTILSGSSLEVRVSSQAVINGNLLLAGSASSAGTLVVGGALYGGGSLSLGGGVADIGQLGAAGTGAATLSFTSASATVRLHGLVGSNSVTAMQVGDEIDLLGNTSVRLADGTITTTTGTIALSAAPTGSHYQLASDGAGGTLVELTADTIGVYRFFDSNYGTHFFSASSSEKNTVVATRPDLIYEGVGLQSIDPSSGDPNASAVYRFFDLTYGTHFFTASTSERDTVISTRPDLVFEGTGFIEHVAQQAGDTAVYRFFDSKYGTHFYTADANERATIVATRPDLIDEGTGFYAPAQ